MAPTFNPLVLLSILMLISVSSSRPSSIMATATRAAAPDIKALLAPIAYDPSTSLYSVTPLADVRGGRKRLFASAPSLLLDLEANNLWRDCLNDTSFVYPSPTLEAVLCGSALCKSLIHSKALGLCDDPCYGPASPVCGNQTCGLLIMNSAIDSGAFGKVWTDTITVRAVSPATGSNPGRAVPVSDFAFVCRDDLLLQNNAVPRGVIGVAGLGKAELGLPTQFASLLRLKRKFAYCLPSVTRQPGILFFGDSPYTFLPGIDVSKNLRYTPLLKTRQDPYTYFIPVTSISVNGARLPLNTSLLQLTYEAGLVKGGTRITSTTRYTQLEPSIYKALAGAFKAAAAARGMKRARPIAPFDTCFLASSAVYTRMGYNVPGIDFALQGAGSAGGEVLWPLFAANSVVSLNNNEVLCLAFTPAAESQRSSIVLGTFQQQNTLMQFDLGKSRLGFTPSLLGWMTTCTNFNFTFSN